ncbi:hypothetical protein DSO57_1030289 [Entomophthora muscae]|uniref:Uncharacterized protein n=1 Tax=Entomophthora muscae TaxID=34485 RepID=A0ACC2T0W1_9FUNG|nr:hypothetical protein DSO57_1030289 [Entomophthora muscae]
MPDNKSFSEVTTCNMGSLGSEISGPANVKFPEPALSLRPDTCPVNLSNIIATNDNPPISEARSSPKIPTHVTGGLGGKISKCINENRPKPVQSPGNDASPETLLSVDYQVIEKKGLKFYSTDTANGNPLMPIATHRILTPAR